MTADTYEKQVLKTLREATLLDVVFSQIWKHQADFNEDPSMILVSKSLWRPLTLQVAEFMGVSCDELVLGAITVNDVPIIFQKFSDPSVFLKVHGSKPSQIWGI